jgi:hypothetical protein
VCVRSESAQCAAHGEMLECICALKSCGSHRPKVNWCRDAVALTAADDVQDMNRCWTRGRSSPASIRLARAGLRSGTLIEVGAPVIARITVDFRGKADSSARLAHHVLVRE